MRDGTKILASADELFCNGTCQATLPRFRFYASNLYECKSCWNNIVKARRRERMRENWQQREVRAGRSPRARYEAMKRIEAGMSRCVLNRPRHDHREVYLATEVQCSALVFEGDQREHLALVHGMDVIDSDRIADCFTRVSPVADRLDADTLD